MFKTTAKFITSFVANGEGVSWKKVWFQISNAVIYITPTILLYQGMITGSEWIDLYQVVFPASIGIYVTGKWVDGQNTNSSKSKNSLPKLPEISGDDEK